MQATMTGLLGVGTLHARVDEIKRSKGAPVVVNDQIVGTLICQPPGHSTDRHYHLTDEWWVVLEGEIDRESRVGSRAGRGSCLCPRESLPSHPAGGERPVGSARDHAAG